MRASAFSEGSRMNLSRTGGTWTIAKTGSAPRSATTRKPACILRLPVEGNSSLPSSVLRSTLSGVSTGMILSAK